MRKYICECCGGTINTRTMKCEYCGCQYEDDGMKPVRVEMSYRPYKTLEARMAVSDYLLDKIGSDKVSELCVKELANKLAESIQPFIDIYVERDVRYLDTIVSGRIRVVYPEGGKT